MAGVPPFDPGEKGPGVDFGLNGGLRVPFVSSGLCRWVRLSMLWAPSGRRSVSRLNFNRSVKQKPIKKGDMPERRDAFFSHPLLDGGGGAAR